MKSKRETINLEAYKLKENLAMTTAAAQRKEWQIKVSHLKDSQNANALWQIAIAFAHGCTQLPPSLMTDKPFSLLILLSVYLCVSS